MVGEGDDRSRSRGRSDPRSRKTSTATAATVPIVAGTADFAVADGRVTAVLTPISPNSTIPAMPIQSRLTARMPMTTAKMPSTTTVPKISIGLSLVPNWRMANSLTATGHVVDDPLADRDHR